MIIANNNFLKINMTFFDYYIKLNCESFKQHQTLTVTMMLIWSLEHLLHLLQQKCIWVKSATSNLISSPLDVSKFQRKMSVLKRAWKQTENAWWICLYVMILKYIWKTQLLTSTNMRKTGLTSIVWILLWNTMRAADSHIIKNISTKAEIWANQRFQIK